MGEENRLTWHWESARHSQRTTLSWEDEMTEKDVLLAGRGAGGILLSSACGARKRDARR